MPSDTDAENRLFGPQPAILGVKPICQGALDLPARCATRGLCVSGVEVVACGFDLSDAQFGADARFHTNRMSTGCQGNVGRDPDCPLLGAQLISPDHTPGVVNLVLIRSSTSGAYALVQICSKTPHCGTICFSHMQCLTESLSIQADALAWVRYRLSSYCSTTRLTICARRLGCRPASCRCRRQRKNTV